MAQKILTGFLLLTASVSIGYVLLCRSAEEKHLVDIYAPEEEEDKLASLANNFGISRADASSQALELYQEVSGNEAKAKVPQEFLAKLASGNPSILVSRPDGLLDEIVSAIGKSNVADWRMKLHRTAVSFSRMQKSASSCKDIDFQFLSGLEFAAKSADISALFSPSLVADQLPFFNKDDISKIETIFDWIRTDQTFGHLSSLEIEVPRNPGGIVAFSQEVSRVEQQIQHAIRQQMDQAKKTTPESDHRKIEDLVIEYETVIDSLTKLAN